MSKLWKPASFQHCLLHALEGEEEEEESLPRCTRRRMTSSHLLQKHTGSFEPGEALNPRACFVFCLLLWILRTNISLCLFVSLCVCVSVVERWALGVGFSDSCFVLAKLDWELFLMIVGFEEEEENGRRSTYLGVRWECWLVCLFPYLPSVSRSEARLMRNWSLRLCTCALAVAWRSRRSTTDIPSSSLTLSFSVSLSLLTLPAASPVV